MGRRTPDAGYSYQHPKPRRLTNRRWYLRAGATVGIASVAGCSSILDRIQAASDDDQPLPDEITLGEFRGSGALVEGRGDIGGTRISDLPDLSGELTIYLGGGEGGLYTTLLGFLQDIYPDFEPKTRLAPTAQLANTIIEEMNGGGSPADVFWAVDAGSLGFVANTGHTRTLPKEIVEPVPEPFHPNDQWVGTAGRARAVPYNTVDLTGDDIPDNILEFPEASHLRGRLGVGWAPTYGAFQAFITAMRLIHGEQVTRDWIRDMLNHEVTEFPGEFLVSNAVADGEISAGFANHYYALRVKNARSEAPINLAFTKNDAGALINTAGAEIITGTTREDLAVTFIRHLLSTEAQEFFATRTFAYPMVSGITPPGNIPSIDELDPPEIDLTELSDLEPTLDLMREVGIL